MEHNVSNENIQVGSAVILLTRTLIVLAMVSLVPSAAISDSFLQTPGGALYKDVVIGGGSPAAVGDVATIHFKGWLANNEERGKELVNSRAERQPISFVIGTERVMPGWNEGVIGMREGGKRLVKLPPELGFGARGSAGVIPPNSGLVFMMELVTLRKAGE